MTSNWKKQCAALALAAAMTASSVVSPLVYAADAALQAEVAVSASAGSEPPQEEESQQEPEAPAEQQLEQPAAQKDLSWVDSDALAMGWQTDFSKTQATTVRYWKDGVLPSDLPEAWDASPAKGTFWLEVTPDETGESAIHCHSEDASARYALMNTKLYGFDYQKNYVLRAWVKAENVSGTGLYMRGQVGAGANKNLGDGYKVKGTTGGWVLYEWPLRDLAEVAGDNADRMKVEVYFEKFTGDLWVKDLKIVEDYKLTLDQTELTGQVGNVLTLNVKADSDQVDLSKLAWTSSDPAIATVENGVVTIHSVGVVTITAAIDEDHSVTCTITVDDPAMMEMYETMRNRWSDRMTGNDCADKSDADYKAAMAVYTEKVSAAWESMVKKPGGEDDRTTLWEDLDLTIKYPGKGQSNAALTADLNTASTRILDMARGWAAEGSELHHNEALGLRRCGPEHCLRVDSERLPASVCRRRHL